MPNTIIEPALLQRAIGAGLDWETAKWKLYAVKKAPWGNSQKLVAGEHWQSSYSNGDLHAILITTAAHGFSLGNKVIVSGMKSTGTRVYVPATNYGLGDLVHANTHSGRPANNYIHRCIIEGSRNSSPKWASNVGGISATDASAGPVFQNTGHVKGEWPMNGVYKLKDYLGTGNVDNYTVAGQTGFVIRTNNAVDKFGSVARSASGYGEVYKIHKYMSEWTPDASIWGTSDALTNTVIRRNGVLDCNDTTISIGANSSADMILLLARVANNFADADLPKNQQEVVAFWDYGRNIGSLYSSDTFTGTAALSMSNMLQLTTPLAGTGADTESVEE